ncbi:MAG: ankyrin repeat domain-containing protein [Anaerolineae bacterium]|nr:ankyrin repeat domain-containing protein [Anaerolineae bacterium]
MKYLSVRQRIVNLAAAHRIASLVVICTLLVNCGNPGVGVQESQSPQPSNEINKTQYQNLTKDEKLIAAIRNGDVETVKAAIADGANVNATTGANFSTVELAVVNGSDTTMLEMLLRAGANPNVVDAPNNTPLMISLIEPGVIAHKGATEMLLKYGADVNFTDRIGTTALHHAVHLDAVESVDLLLKNGANINAKDDSFRTPLIDAVRMGNYASVQLLLDRGANATTPNKEGKTALMIAKEKSIESQDDTNRRQIYQLLQDKVTNQPKPR